MSNINTKIEQIKRDGEINALKHHINSLHYKITKGDIWDEIQSEDIYVRLRESIKDAEDILCEMLTALDALKELEPANN